MQRVPIGTIKNNPNNPRVIKDDKFKKLVQSIKDLPEMAEVRPVVVNTDMVVLGGNMRLKAMREAGWKDVPIQVVDWDEYKQRQFIIKDNVSGGEWDWDMLANEWDTEQLKDWGIDLPIFAEEPFGDDLIGDEKNKPATIKITFTSPEQLQQAEIDIQELLDRKYKGAFFSVSAGEI
jgi:ParB-like chromosome segregation protein Spo0J